MESSSKEACNEWLSLSREHSSWVKVPNELLVHFWHELCQLNFLFACTLYCNCQTGFCHFLASGSAIGFRLDSLLKLTETRARNNRMTLMHYLCKVLVTSSCTSVLTAFFYANKVPLVWKMLILLFNNVFIHLSWGLVLHSSSPRS